LLATLGGFLFGYDTSNIGSALAFVPYHLNGFWTGYLVAGASLGAVAGALLAGPLTDRFGRTSLLIADAAIYAFGALLSAVTPDAAAKRRRALNMLQQWMITVGILVAYLIALFALFAGAGLTWASGNARIVLAMIGLCLFIASLAAGVGGTAWLIQGEMFPTAVRGQAAATAATVDWIANVAIIEVFPTLESGIGLAWVLVIFAALSATAVVFVMRYLPETKGRTVEEITEIFEKQARERVAATTAAATVPQQR
jgi:MFS family permease